MSAEARKQVIKKKNGQTVTWTVANLTTPLTSVDSQPAKKIGLVDGLPILNGEPDLLRLWSVLYPGDIKLHISAINAAGIKINHKFQPINEHEYVRFWGMCLVARPFF